MNPNTELRAVGAVLALLRRTPGEPVNSEEIESKTGLDRTALKAVIRHLRESGVEIDTSGRGYTLQGLPEIILPAILHADLKSRVMGWEVHSYKVVGSTNEAAKRLAESGAPEGTLVVSERQTRGRGRLGRNWQSPTGLGLYFTLILRPQVDIERMPALSMVAALSVSRVLDIYTGQETQIKWPNDCLIQARKAAGVLIELSGEIDRVSYAVLGIGINVNQKSSDFSSSLKSKATSLFMITGRKLDRTAILGDFLLEFEKAYNNFQRYGLRFLGPDLVKRSTVLGKKITLTLGKNKINGVAVGIDENGALRVQEKSGVHAFAAGEVTLR